MKKITLFTIIALKAIELNAQNVGINTNAPTTTLDVNGTIRIRGGNPVNGNVLATDANGLASWINPAYAQSNTYVFSDNENDATLLSNNYTNVGSTFINIYQNQSSTPVPQTWMKTSQLLNNDGSSKVIALDSSRFYVYGGTSDNASNYSGAIYDPIKDSWTNVPASGASNGSGSYLFSANGKIVIWSGNVGRIFSPASQQWSDMNTTNAPASDAQYASGYDSTTNTLVLWGGSSLNTGFKYSFTTNTWSPMTTTNAPSGRLGKGYAVGNGKLFIIGGITPSGSTFLSDAYLYDIATDTWTLLPASGLGARDNIMTAFTGSGIVAFGGSANGGPIGGGAVYNLSSNSWSLMSTTGAPTNLSGVTTAFANNKFVVIPVTVSTTYLYDVNTNTWSNFVGGSGGATLAGNAVGLFSFSGGTTSHIGNRFFWSNATPVSSHPYALKQLFIYKKN